MKLTRYLTLVLLLLAFQSLATEDFPGIKGLMTDQQLKETGLDQLSPEQIKKLNEWLTSYTANEAEQIKQTSKSVQAVENAPIVSQIEGKFRGWTGDTVFRLKNGQVWRQRIGGRYWIRIEKPKVEIRKNVLGFYEMEILESGKTVGVKRLK